MFPLLSSLGLASVCVFQIKESHHLKLKTKKTPNKQRNKQKQKPLAFKSKKESPHLWHIETFTFKILVINSLCLSLLFPQLSLTLYKQDMTGALFAVVRATQRRNNLLIFTALSFSP